MRSHIRTLCAVFALGIFLCTGVQDTVASPSEEAADRVVRCGLGKSFHAGRRAELARRLKQGVAVFRGLTSPREMEDFQQDKTFWYLTGIESRDAALVIDVNTGKEILFLPEATGGLAFTESWDGDIWDSEDDWIPELTGFTDIRPNVELLETLEGLTQENKKVWVSKHPVIKLRGSYDTASKHNNTVARR